MGDLFKKKKEEEGELICQTRTAFDTKYEKSKKIFKSAN